MQTFNFTETWQRSPFARWWDAVQQKRQAYNQRYLTEKARAKLLADIRDAHRAWQVAESHLREVVGADQIDCAIYLYEAAQKKYEMLLRQAKHTRLYATDYHLQSYKRAL
jgi:hypothetical protein